MFFILLILFLILMQHKSSNPMIAKLEVELAGNINSCIYIYMCVYKTDQPKSLPKPRVFPDPSVFWMSLQILPTVFSFN